MTLPHERTQAIQNARIFLGLLSHHSKSKGVPTWIRKEAINILKHYPNDFDMLLDVKDHSATVRDAIDAITDVYNKALEDLGEVPSRDTNTTYQLQHAIEGLLDTLDSTGYKMKHLDEVPDFIKASKQELLEYSGYLCDVLDGHLDSL